MNSDDLVEQMQASMDRQSQGDTYDECVNDNALAYSYRLDFNENDIRHSIIVQTHIPSDLMSSTGEAYQYHVIVNVVAPNYVSRSRYNANTSIECDYYVSHDEVVNRISEWKDKRGWYGI
jgi:hypothetical protein